MTSPSRGRCPASSPCPWGGHTDVHSPQVGVSTPWHAPLRSFALGIGARSERSGEVTGEGHHVPAQLLFSHCCPSKRLLLSPGLGQGSHSPRHGVPTGPAPALGLSWELLALARRHSASALNQAILEDFSHTPLSH